MPGLPCRPGPRDQPWRGGLALWGDALADLGAAWTTYASDAALVGPPGISGLLDRVDGQPFPVVPSPAFHLRTNLRAYRNAAHGEWVESLLTGDLARAAQVAADMPGPPAVITRDLSTLKEWLRPRCRGNQRVGLLASSGAVRLVGEGVPPSPRSNELDSVVHWFLRPTDDYRSSNALETPLSEFVCQGWSSTTLAFAGGTT